MQKEASLTSQFTHWKVPVVWLILCFIVGLVGLLIGAKTSLPGPSSQEAILLSQGETIAAAHQLHQRDQVLVELRNSSLKVDDPLFAASRDSLHATLKDLLTPDGTKAFSAVQTVEHSWLPTEIFTSSDRHSLLLIGRTNAPRISSSRALSLLPAAIEEWNQKHPSFVSTYLSSGTADSEIFALINDDLDRSLLVTLPLTFLVLIWSFGSIVLALIPLFLALVSLWASLGVAALISLTLGPISATAAQLVVLLVLAIGVDYTLFFISRIREEIAKGLPVPTAIHAAREHISPAIFWSGSTVALSLVGLLVVQDSIMTSMAYVTLAAVVITVAGALTALPKIMLGLAACSDTIWQRHRITLMPHPHSPNGIFPKLLDISMRHPVTVLLSLLILLCALTIPVLSIRLGSSVQPPLLPAAMQSKRAFDSLGVSFPAIAGPDLSVILATPRISDREDDGDVQPFFDKLLESGRVRGPLSTDYSENGAVGRYEFRVQGSTNDAENIELTQLLRSQVIPEFSREAGIDGFLGGTLPYAVDERDRYSKRTIGVFVVVLSLSFFFLLVAFRSLVIPIKAVLLNLLSTGASFGLLVLLFQGGPLCIWNYGVIESFVPPLLFSILFGLSMDYHIFLLSRIREEVITQPDIRLAIRQSVLATAKTITSAAMIMVAVFGVIAALQLPVMKQLGIGLALAVLIDATVIRIFLLPASMVLLGRFNWYLPERLRWLPVIKL